VCLGSVSVSSTGMLLATCCTAAVCHRYFLLSDDFFGMNLFKATLWSLCACPSVSIEIEFPMLSIAVEAATCALGGQCVYRYIDGNS